MLALLMTMLGGAGYVFAMQMTDVKKGNRYAATMVIYIFGVVASAVLMEKKIFFYNTPEGWFALGLSFVTAICMVAGMLYGRKCIAANGAPMQATFYKLGILIPMACSLVFFGEIPTLPQIIGVAIVVFALVYMNLSLADSKNITSFPLLIIMFVIGGLVEFSFKMYNMYGDIEIKEYYLFYNFLFAAIISLVVLLKNNKNIKKDDVIWGVLTGIPNYFIMFFSLLAVAALPTYIVYPTSSVGTILIVNLLNLVLFKEVPTKKELIATGFILVALVFLNI